jgi:hypothetical protein
MITKFERERIMPTSLEKLIDAARNREFAPEEREAQRRSFAYGNTNIENSRITRQTIDEQAELLKQRATQLDPG